MYVEGAGNLLDGPLLFNAPPDETARWKRCVPRFLQIYAQASALYISAMNCIALFCRFECQPLFRHRLDFLFAVEQR
jgi:hypothetical protein